MEIKQLSELIMDSSCKNSSDAYKLAFYKSDNEKEISNNINEKNCFKFKINIFNWLNKNKNELLTLPDILITNKSLLTEEEKKLLETLPIKVFDSKDINLNNKDDLDKKILEIRSLMYESKMIKYLQISENLIKNIEEKYSNSNLNNDIIVNNLINEMLKLLKEKDEITFEHVNNVSKYVDILVSGMPDDKKYNEEEITNIKRCALVHDIGKLTIPNQILKKNDSLDETEYKKMKEHVNENVYLFNNELMQKYKSGALCHHERYDGKGYPNGLKGEEIPLSARIISILDTYDALTGNRKYMENKRKTPEEAIEIIKKEQGNQFDPVLCEYFINGLNKNLELQSTGGLNK